MTTQTTIGRRSEQTSDGGNRTGEQRAANRTDRDTRAWEGVGGARIRGRKRGEERGRGI
jgi:hypothetical protein